MTDSRDKKDTPDELQLIWKVPAGEGDGTAQTRLFIPELGHQPTIYTDSQPGTWGEGPDGVGFNRNGMRYIIVFGDEQPFTTIAHSTEGPSDAMDQDQALYTLATIREELPAADLELITAQLEAAALKIGKLRIAGAPSTSPKTSTAPFLDTMNDGGLII